MIFIALFLLVTGAGAIYEMSARIQATHTFPAPGKMIDIGGRRIQLDCRGTGTPTVIFESGLDMYGSLSWSAVHDEIAKTTRACAYSRAGIMWSDPKNGVQNGKTIAEDLHATLIKAGELGPFVLVGHSLGGPYIMTYTKYYGSEVAGLVFVDASHPDQVQRFNEVGKLPSSNLMNLRNKIGAALNWAGVVRAVASTYDRSPNQPKSVFQAMNAYASTSFGPMLKEEASIDGTLAEAGTIRQLGNRPIFVLTAMAPMSEQGLKELKWTDAQASRYQNVWEEMHNEEAAWSSHSIHQLIPDSGHYTQFDRPDLVIEAVRSVVENVRSNRN